MYYVKLEKEIHPLTLILKIFIWGITCLLTPSVLAKPIQSETLFSEPPGKQATKVKTLFELQSVGSSLINPVNSAPIISTVPAPEFLETSVPLQGKVSDWHFTRVETKTLGELVWSDTNFLNLTTSSQQQLILAQSTWSTEAEDSSLAASSLEISQTTVIPAAASELLAGFASANDPQTDREQSNRWYFKVEPFIYLPVTIYGDATFDRFTENIAIGTDQITTTIKDDLNFGFFGEFQAWTPNYHWGLLANVDYLSTSSKDTLSTGLVNSGPSELQAKVDSEVWYVNLAAAYRFYDRSKVNPEGVSTEFDLGTFVFDIVGGLNITSVNTNLDLSTNLGEQAEFDDGATVVSPVIGGLFRANISPKLALVTAGAVSGFDIDGLTQWNVRLGLDWMFAGKTSLGLGYRFSSTSYNKNTDNDRDFEVNLNQNGPYLGFAFRF